MSGRVAIGDRVTYSRRFLQSAGIWQKEIADRVGTVTASAAPGEAMVRVKWEDTGIETLIREENVWPIDRLHLEPA